MIELINMNGLNDTPYTHSQIRLNSKKEVIEAIKHSRVSIGYQFPLQEFADTFHKNTHTLEGVKGKCTELRLDYEYPSTKCLLSTYASFELDNNTYLINISKTSLNNKIHNCRYTNLAVMMVNHMHDVVPEFDAALKSLDDSYWAHTKKAVLQLMIVYVLESKDLMEDIANLNFGDLSLQIDSLNDIFGLKHGWQVLIIDALVNKRREDIIRVVSKVDTIQLWTTVDDYKDFINTKQIFKYKVDYRIMSELCEFRTEEIDNETLIDLFGMMVTSCPNINPSSLNSFLLMIKHYKLSYENLNTLDSLINKAKTTYGGTSSTTWLKKVAIIH